MIQDRLDVILEKRGKISLFPNDYLATGGEGSIYKKSNTIIKLYTDESKMAREDLAGKIQILSRLKHPFIVSPVGVVFDVRNKPIGFYMPFVDKGEALPRVFTNEFRTRTGFDNNDASVLVDRMHKVVNFVHNNQILLVDANEMNWFVVNEGAGKNPEPRVIDVDSWSVGSKWGAKVIMPSIRDWHIKGFNELTDWFAWGIVTFQIYTGIHPYKGTLPGYKPGEMERRMKENASVFSKGIRLNCAVRDFSSIPNQLLDWYFATFERGKRNTPPSPFDQGKNVANLNNL